MSRTDINTKQMSKRAERLEILIFTAAVLLFGALCAFLYYRESIRYGGVYKSDLFLHLKQVKKNGGGGYSLDLATIWYLYRLFDRSTKGVAIYMALIQMFTIPSVYCLLLSLDRVRKIKTTAAVRRTYRWASFLCLFVVSVMIPGFYPYFYQGNMHITCWHNDTYLAMRLFAILSMAVYFLIYGELKERLHPGLWLLLAALLVITTMEKPSFLMGFAPVMALSLLVELIRNRRDWKVLGRIVMFGCSIFPSLFVILWQTRHVYGGEESSGQIIFSPLTTFAKNGDPVIKMALFLIFPLVILIWHFRKKIEERFSFWYVQTWMLWGVEITYNLLLAESGHRMYHANFAWGSMFGNFFLYLVSMYLMLESCREIARKKQQVTAAERVYFCFNVIASLWLLGTGISYLLILLTGHDYRF